MIAYFDIETNGLYQDVTQGHCMVIKMDDEVLKFRRHEGVHQGALKLLEVLQQGGFICGHNIIDYDIPTLEKLFPDVIFDRKYRGQIIDTLVLARLIYSNIKDKDFGLMKAGKIPGDLVGSHKLEAWGYRLGVFKGTYGKHPITEISSGTRRPASKIARIAPTAITSLMAKTAVMDLLEASIRFMALYALSYENRATA